MILTFLLSGLCLTMKMARGLGWGPLVLPPLSGESCTDPVAEGKERGEESGRWGSGVEGESGEVSESVGEFDEGEGEGQRCGW